MAAQRTVGFVGLGEMGLPMARRLLERGRPVAGCEVDPQRRRAAADAGVDVLGSPAEVAAAADGTVVVMVRTTAQVEQVLFGDSGCATGAGRPLDLVVTSTLDPAAMQRISGRLDPAVGLLDAPVSGGVRGAQDGTLAIMVAGEPARVERARPLLEMLGGRVVAVGERPGQGQAVKLANQTMMAAAMAGTAEGLAIAQRYGVERDRVVEVVGEGTGSSWVLRNWDWMRSLWEDYEPGGALDVLYKDMRALLDVAGAEWNALPVAAAAFQQLLELWGSHEAVARAHRAGVGAPPS